MSVLPFVVLIGFLGAAAGLKCYVGTPLKKTELTCPASDLACSTVTVQATNVKALACSPKSFCDKGISGSKVKCCFTDLCNSAGNIPSSNILMIFTMSLSMMLAYIM